VERQGQFLARRIIWSLMVLSLVVPLLCRIRLPQYVTPPTLGVYQAMGAIPKDKILVLSCNWSPGTVGENAPQTEALMRDAFKRNIKFAIFGWNAAPGPELCEKIAERLAEKYHKRYGYDWVNWGFHTGGDPMINGWAKDLRSVAKVEASRDHKPYERVPMLRGIRTAKDSGLVVEITPAGTLGTMVRYVYGVYRTPIAFACTGVMAAEAYDYLDSGQIVGIMRGLAGAAEYEKLIEHPGLGVKGMIPQSFAHLLIVILIVLGNILYLYSRRRERILPTGEVSEGSGSA